MATINKTVWILAVALLSGCVREAQTEHPPIPYEGTVQVTLSVKIPFSSNSSTRAMDENMEGHVETIDVLAFKADPLAGDGIKYFWYGAKAEKKTSTTGDNEFMANLAVSTQTQHLVFIVNARAQVEALGQIGSNNSMEDILNSLQFHETGQKWNVSNASDFAPIPMWGELDNLLIEDDTKDIGRVELLRMLSRVDVVVDQRAHNDFKLTGVYLYNRKTRGFIAPLTENLIRDNSGRYLGVSAPSVPDDNMGDPLTVKGPVPYEELTTADTELVNTIYTFEAAAVPTGEWRNATCLVIGGKYKTDAQPTFYRVDFFMEDGVTPRPLLRNHRYKFNIVEVLDRGKGDQETAFSSKPENLRVEIIAWDAADMKEVVFDGVHQLSVNTAEIGFYREGREFRFRVYTDHPSGWEIEDLPDWLEAQLIQGPADEMAVFGITADPVGVDDPERSGFFNIRAGNLLKKIDVLQRAEPELSITVSPNEIYFGRRGGVPRSITVSTFPTDAPRYFSVGGDMIWGNGGFPNNGEQSSTYYFTAAPNDTGNQISSLVTVFIKSGELIASATVKMIQLASEILFNVLKKDPYPAAGGSEFFEVGSEAEWHILTKNDSSDILSDWSTATNQAGYTNYTFTLAPNYTYATRQASFRVTSPVQYFTDQDVVITQGYDAPTIEISDPANNIVDFGQSAQSRPVAFSLNAKWKFDYDDQANYLAVVDPAGTSHVPGRVYDGGGPLDQQSAIIVFSPLVIDTPSPDDDIQAAGTRLETSLTLATQQHSPAPGDTKIIRLIRATPGYYEYRQAEAEVSTYLPIETTWVDVTSATNMEWTAGNNVNAGWDRTDPAGPWGEKTVRVTIPDNKANWTGDREIIIYAQEKGGARTERARFIQKGNLIVFDKNDVLPPIASAPIPGHGETYTLKFSGRSPAFLVRWVNPEQWGFFAQCPEIDEDQSYGESTVVLEVTNNGTGAPRTLSFQYQNPQTNTWQVLFTHEQAAGNLLISDQLLLAKHDVQDGTGARRQLTWAEAAYQCSQYWENSQSDPRTGKGKWVVPDWRVIQSIYNKFYKIGNTGGFAAGKYWTNTSTSAGYTYMDFSNGVLYDSYSPNNTYYVRCIRMQDV